MIVSENVIIVDDIFPVKTHEFVRLYDPYTSISTRKTLPSLHSNVFYHRSNNTIKLFLPDTEGSDVEVINQLEDLHISKPNCEWKVIMHMINHYRFPHTTGMYDDIINHKNIGVHNHLIMFKKLMNGLKDFWIAGILFAISFFPACVMMKEKYNI